MMRVRCERGQEEAMEEADRMPLVGILAGVVTFGGAMAHAGIHSPDRTLTDPLHSDPIPGANGGVDLGDPL
jgi:hypothetical protein